MAVAGFCTVQLQWDVVDFATVPLLSKRIFDLTCKFS